MPPLLDRQYRHRLLKKLERGEALKPMEWRRLKALLMEPAVGLVFEDAPTPEPLPKSLALADVVMGPPPTTELYIGDNLPILEAWRHTHRTFDLIYLDPPYNTGRTNMGYFDQFENKTDRFHHSDWCRFIEPRLRALHALLDRDGVLFVSIDERELAPLKLLLDEVFGDNNFIQCFTWEKTQHYGRQTKNAYRNTEFILVYAKQLHTGASTKRLLVERVYGDLEDAPLFNRINPKNTLTFPVGCVDTYLPDGQYTQSQKPDQYTLEKPVTFKKGVNTTPLVLTFSSRWNQAKAEEAIQMGVRFLIKTEAFSIRAQYPSAQLSTLSPRQAIVTDPNHPQRTQSRYGEWVGTHEEGTRTLQEWGLYGTLLHPKPISLMTYLISLLWRDQAQTHGQHLRILDPFAGSGTTAHAVAHLNTNHQEKHTVTLIAKPEGQIVDEVLIPRLQALQARWKTPYSVLRTD